MTTSVTINTHGGWPVRVREVDSVKGTFSQERIIDPKQSITLYVHSGTDLHIHEVQPGEVR